VQDIIIDLEDQIKDLEDVLFDRRWGTTGRIEMRLLPNEVKRKITGS
jgi:hypothetical protein